MDPATEGTHQYEFVIPLPDAWGRSKFYPTLSCVQHDAWTRENIVSMEGLPYHEAQAPVAR